MVRLRSPQVRMPMTYSHSRGQTSLEYLLLLTVVAVIVIASFGKGSLVDQIHNAAGGYYNSVTQVIMGTNPKRIDGGWCPVTCPPMGYYGFNVMYRACECPAPAFGGLSCTDPHNLNALSCPTGQTCRGSEVICNGVNACGACPTGQVCVAKSSQYPDGCACQNGLNKDCSLLGSGFIPDATCSNCICPQGQPLEAGGCGCCPYGYTYGVPPGSPPGTTADCYAVSCGTNSTLYDTGKGCDTGCECDKGAFYDTFTGQCVFCPIGQHYNGVICVNCPTGEVQKSGTTDCYTPTCTGANMYWDTDPTSSGYHTCACESKSESYDPITKGCVSNYICSSTFPANATPCPNTKTKGSADSSKNISWTLSATCDGSVPCQYYSNSCNTSNKPANTVACPAPTPTIPMPSTPPSWTLVYTCDNTKLCEAICNPDPSNPYGLACSGTLKDNGGTAECKDGNKDVPFQCQSIYLCPAANLPTGYLPCPNDPANVMGHVPAGTTQWKLDPNEAACGTTPCEAYKYTPPPPCTFGSGCSGKVCGTDACGNTDGCGTCPFSGESCVAGKCTCPDRGQCPVIDGITNVCGADTCGNPDGCNGPNACSFTQNCPSGNCICSSGQCVCKQGSGCSGKVCGPDACGFENGCGSCGVGYACSTDQTQCIPCPQQGLCPKNAQGIYNQCGPDTCGFANGCGTCPSGQTCDAAFMCCVPQTPCGANNCGQDDCGKACPVTCTTGTSCSSTTTPGTCVTNTCGSLPGNSQVCTTNPPTVNGASYIVGSSCPSATTYGCYATCQSGYSPNAASTACVLSCVPNCSCASSICVGSSCTDPNCGTSCPGTEPANCNGYNCGTSCGKSCGSCSGEETCSTTNGTPGTCGCGTGYSLTNTTGDTCGAGSCFPTALDCCEEAKCVHGYGHGYQVYMYCKTGLYQLSGLTGKANQCNYCSLGANGVNNCPVTCSYGVTSGFGHGSTCAAFNECSPDNACSYCPATTTAQNCGALGGGTLQSCAADNMFGDIAISCGKGNGSIVACSGSGCGSGGGICNNC
jgi:Flp pilus assembly pilin Flp